MFKILKSIYVIQFIIYGPHAHLVLKSIRGLPQEFRRDTSFICLLYANS
jgi:hypothetical protein